MNLLKAYAKPYLLTKKFKKTEDSVLNFPMSVKDFKAKSVACVVSCENSFVGMRNSLELLGFEVACSTSMAATFEAVIESPKDWALVLVRLDQPIDEVGMEKYVRNLRLLDTNIPVVVVAEKGGSPMRTGAPTLIADLAVKEPRSVMELSEVLIRAVSARTTWGSSFKHYRRYAS